MTQNLKEIFTAAALAELFPKERTDRFFEALFGGTEDGAYDIHLHFKEHTDHELRFEFELTRRPGKCLVCSLTHGLPKVFSRHPVINVEGLYRDIAKRLDKSVKCTGWRLGMTYAIDKDVHCIPFTIALASSS